MTANRFVGRNALSDGILRCVENVEHHMVTADSGLHVTFESGPISWSGLNRMRPFYVARHDYDRDGPEAGTPDAVKVHLTNPDWVHFVWVPFEVAQGSLGQFTIRYAHELQHYRQVRNPQFSRDARRFLQALKHGGYVPTLKVELLPNEFDADLAALQVFRDIHGEAALSDHIAAESRDRHMANYFRRLLDLESRWLSRSGRDA